MSVRTTSVSGRRSKARLLPASRRREELPEGLAPAAAATAGGSLLRRALGGAGVALALLVAGSGRPAEAAISITLGTTAISFPNANPATTSSIPALANPISVQVKLTGADVSKNWVMTVLASGDLLSGGATIPISAVSWTATGSGFVGGTLSTSGPRLVGFGTGTQNGTLSFFFANGFSYATGSYSQTITFTATSF